MQKLFVYLLKDIKKKNVIINMIFNGGYKRGWGGIIDVFE